MHHQPPTHNRSYRGVTLVESAICCAVLAVLVSVVAPGFGQAQERARLQGAAALLETDIQHARSLAVARNESVRISFAHSAAGSCYTVHTGAAAQCSCTGSGQAVCTGTAQALRTVHYAAADGASRIVSNTRSMLFDAAKGTVTPTATVRVTAASGAEIRQIVNIMGRVRSCSPDSRVPGLRAC